MNYLKLSLGIILLGFMACSEPAQEPASNSNSEVSTATTTTETNTAAETNTTSDDNVLSIKSKEDLEKNGLYAEYWSRPNIDGPEDGDEYISINDDTSLSFEGYGTREDEEGEIEIEANFSCEAKLSFAGDNSLALDKGEDYCLDDHTKIWFLKTAEHTGISFDGKTIAFYKK